MQRTSTETGGSGGSPESSADMLRFEDDVCRSKPASQSSGLHSFMPDPVSDLVDDRTLLEDGGSSGLVTLLARVSSHHRSKDGDACGFSNLRISGVEERRLGFW